MPTIDESHVYPVSLVREGELAYSDSSRPKDGLRSFGQAGEFMSTTSAPRRMTTATSPPMPATACAAEDQAARPWRLSTWSLSLGSGLLLAVALAPVSVQVVELLLLVGSLWVLARGSTAFPHARWIALGTAIAMSFALAVTPFTWLIPQLPPLAFIAPLGFLLLIKQETLAGRRPYLTIWLAGFVHWLIVMEGVRQAYWALYLGWIALAAYLAVYFALFVGLSRVAVRRLRIPLVLAAPTIWVGLEFARSHFLTGFSIGLLGHSQAEAFPWLIQVADLGGAYAVSFVVMLVAAGIAQALPWNRRDRRWSFAPLVTAGAVLVAVLGYGAWRMATAPHATARPPLSVALLQNSVDTIFDVPPEHFVETCRAYQHQAVAAARQYPQTQVMIWPESVFMSVFPQYTFDGEESLPEGVSWKRAQLAKDEFHQHCASTVAAINQTASTAAGQRRSIAQIMGSMTVGFQRDGIARYNSALMLADDGDVAAQYHKMHPVMFGEYIPLGETWPWIYRFTPMPEGLTRGKQAEAFVVGDYTLAPSICFESTVPHLIRRQIIDLEQRGQSPDMLVSVTNDGWFWGSAQLDLHAQCAIMRAVEHRRPMLVAANTGFSIAVDGSGRVLAKGPRRAVATLAVDVPPDGRFSPYTYFGDYPAALCLALVAVCAAVGLRRFI